MEKVFIESAEKLIDFISKSPTAFQVVDTISDRLIGAGYEKLSECDKWELKRGGKYFVSRNMSSIIAFELPESLDSFMIAASHTDSPTFKLKENYESVAFNQYVRLNTERYGGMILSCWLDRPLSVAGRVFIKDGDKFFARSVVVDRNVCLIPNVAIHFNRAINDGYKYNPAVDMLPLYSDMNGKGSLKNTVVECAGVSADDIVSMDLFLYDRTPGCVWGASGEFFSTPRIDNLGCAFSTLEGLLNSRKNTKAAKVFACFDNEETGSGTKQGAASMFLRDTFERICEFYGADLRRVLASSFMLSADNGHAQHPNHPELSDAQNAPQMNGGVVIKTNASQKYATDAISSALFAEVCARANVPVQKFANRSDLGGGSTLGSISDTTVPLCTVDIGMAQLSMHSCYETGGTKDVKYMADAAAEFFSLALESDGEINFKLI